MMAIFLWCLMLSLTVLLVGLGLGFIINLPGWTAPVLITCLKTFFITGFLAFLLCPPIAFFASVGHYSVVSPDGPTMVETWSSKRMASRL